MSLSWNGPWSDVEAWCREIWVKIEAREWEPPATRVVIRLRAATLHAFPVSAVASDDDLVQMVNDSMNDQFTGYDEASGIRTAPITLALVGNRDNGIHVDLSVVGPWTFTTSRPEPLSATTGPAGRAPMGAHPLRAASYPQAPAPPQAPDPAPGYSMARSERTSMRAPDQGPNAPSVVPVTIDDYANNPLAAMAVQFTLMMQMQFQQTLQINAQLSETLRSLTAPDGFLAAERDALIGSNANMAKTLADLAHNTSKEAASTVKDVIATQGKLKDAEAERRVAVEQARQAQRDKDAAQDAEVAKLHQKYAESRAKEDHDRMTAELNEARNRAAALAEEQARMDREREREAKRAPPPAAAAEPESNDMLQGLVGSVVEQALPSVLERFGFGPKPEAQSEPEPEPAPAPAPAPAAPASGPPRQAMRPPTVRIPVPTRAQPALPPPPVAEPFGELDLGELDLGDLDLGQEDS